MKKIIFYASSVFAVLSFWMVSCKQEKEHMLSLQNFISIGELRSMYQGEPITISSQKNNEDIFISGIIISNTAQGNHPEGKIIVQNNTDGQLRGIVLALDESITRYQIGDSIVAKVEGKKLERVDGALQVSGLTIREVGRITTNNAQAVHIETNDLASIVANREVYESTLVRVLGVDVSDVVRDQTFIDKEVELSDGNNEISLAVRETAAFAAALVPFFGNFTGILQYPEAQQPRLWMRSGEDYSGKYFPPEEYFGFPEGWENIIGNRKAGTIGNSGSDLYPSGRWDITFGLTRQQGNFYNRRDDWTMMLSHTAESHVSMTFDLSHGASQFSFYYGAATTVNPDTGKGGKLYVEYSRDKGENWVILGSAITVPAGQDPSGGGPGIPGPWYTEFNDLDIKGCVRFRIRSEPLSPAGARMSVDDIYIKPNPNSDSCDDL